MRRLPLVKPTPLERFDVYGLTAGWNASANQDALSDNEISDGRNIEINSDRTITPRPGTSQRGNFLGSTTRILGLFEYIKPSDGTRKLIADYDTSPYVLTGTDWESAALGVTSGIYAEYANYLDRAYRTAKGVTTAGKLGVNYHDGSSWTNVSGFPVAGATASDSCAGLTVHKERLIGWNTTNNPKRVYYSDANAHTIGALNYFDVDEPVVVCVSLFEYLLVFTENYVYRIGSFIYTGVAFQPNSILPIPTHVGCIARRTAKVVGDYVYFLSRTGICRTDGHSVQNISDPRVQTYLDATVSKAIVSLSCAGVDMNLYRLQLSTNGTTQDVQITYDSKNDAFFPPITGRAYSCMATFVESGVQKLLAGSDSDGTVYQLNQTHFYDETCSYEYPSGQDEDGAVDGNPALRKAQSFAATANASLVSVSLYLKKNAGTTTELTVRIETDSSGKPSGTLVTNGSTTISAFTTTGYRWKTATFSTPPSLVSGTTYWIVLQHTTEGSGTSQYYWGRDGSSPTASGSSAAYALGAWTADATKDMLFRACTKGAYEKYFVTKGYPLGSPQHQKILKRMYVELDSSGNFFAQAGINTDLYTSFIEQSVYLSGNAPIRGSVTRGAFTRGTQSKISQVIKLANIRGRRIKLRIYNANADEDFTFYGATINYRTRTIPR